MIKWALLGWLSSSLTDQLIRLISSRDNWQSLHHHHSYKQTSEAQVNQVIFNRSPPRFWNGPVHSKVFLMFLSFCIQTGIRELSLSWKPRDPIIAQISNSLFYHILVSFLRISADLSFQIWRFQRRRMQIIIPNQNGWKISDLPLSSTPLLNPPLPFTSNLC